MPSDDGLDIEGEQLPAEADASGRVVYLMRGLPCCGKSTAARKLAGDRGVVCETDEYFYTQVGDDPARYDYRPDLLEEARRWCFERFRRAVDAGVTPIVVDRGNSLSPESRAFARYAADRGYRVELKEPESEWWREIRSLLGDKGRNRAALERWAVRLAEMSREGHRVPLATIWKWMGRWRPGLTVEDILNYEPPGPPGGAMNETFYAGLRGGPEAWGSRFVASLPRDGSGGEPEISTEGGLPDCREGGYQAAPFPRPLPAIAKDDPHEAYATSQGSPGPGRPGRAEPPVLHHLARHVPKHPAHRDRPGQQ